MRVLIIGSGGREHALAWAIAASPLLTALFIAPGNPGTALLGTNVPIRALDVDGLVRFAVETRVDLVIPGPEAPLVVGIADALASVGVACCGPTAGAAQLEGSKRFTKEIAAVAGIPTAAWASFTDAEGAHDYVEEQGAPIVIKADGLAAGKGVVVAETLDEAHEAIEAMLQDRVHGAAGACVVIEERLLGEEVSLFALCDGQDALYLGCAAAHKRVGDGDSGPNTGGMGAVAPPPWINPALVEQAMAQIIRPALAALAARGTPFRGFLFAGLMLTQTGPSLIEFNVRLGDPEAETLLPLLRSDILPALLAATEGGLKYMDLRWRDAASATVVMAAKGYPGAYATGSEIYGLEEAGALPGVTIFHAGTMADQGGILANGGRVLAVNATGTTLRDAVARAYAAVDAIEWPDGFCRRDIGKRAVFASLWP